MTATTDRRERVFLSALVRSKVLPSPKKARTLAKLFGCLEDAVTEIERNEILQVIVDCITRPLSDSESDSIDEVAKRFNVFKDVDAQLASHRKHVASRVVHFRTKVMGWTQHQLAEKCGLPQSHISRIENCTLAPTRLTISKLANAFGVRMSDIDLSFND